MRSRSGWSAEEPFADFVNRGAKERDFEELLARHPECSADLSSLHSAWNQLASMLGRLGLGSSLDERLFERLGDSGPAIELEPEQPSPDGGALDEALGTLSGRQVFGRYRVKDTVGRGGMGVVMRVWDADLRRHLAMKLVRSGEVRDETSGKTHRLGRFLEEARITAQLDHPGIVPVHELGLDPSGRLYFTMKLVAGKTLAEAFGERAQGSGDWTEARLATILLRVCEAMSYAHARRVVHRDLKPENVMIGDFGEVYVMDWGLARVLEDLRAGQDDLALDTDSPAFTAAGHVVGTPAYMPPEQADGATDRMGPHSDVYAVGAMLYQLLAGHAPYLERGSPSGNVEVWERVRREPPLPLRRVAPEAPAELVAICEKAMARDPRARYPDMSGLARDLANHLEGRVVGAYEAGTWAEARKWIRRNSALAGALAAFVVVLMAGLVASGVLYARAERRSTDVLRLSALRNLEDLRSEADTLWPAHPDVAGACEDWLARAGAALAALPGYRTRREELRVEIEAWAGDAPVETRWWHDQLTALVERLEALERDLVAPDGLTPEAGWSVTRRLRFANDLEAAAEPGGSHARLWEEAASALRAAYDFEVRPQVGLVPLGPDPESGLWEFASAMSGEVPTRGADGRLVLDEASAIVLVLLPGGRFLMGAQVDDPSGPCYDRTSRDIERPAHEVELSPFFFAKHELTQGQWKHLTGVNPAYSTEPPLVRSLRHPVEQINWSQARQWLARVGLEMPSEAQWEYAARAGTTTPWWTGAERESIGDADAANLADAAAARYGVQWPSIGDWPEFEDGYVLHSPVGAHAPNPFGLHDMVGNVFEWCLDGFFEDYYSRSPERDPVAPWSESPSRVLRSGCFASIVWSARSTTRGDFAPTVADGNIGLRAARPLDP